MNRQFKKGDVPHNKGKKLQDYLSPEKIAKIKATQFVEGVHTGEGSISWKGGVQNYKNDCTYLWSGTNERKRRPVVVYEQVHGKLPDNWVIYHLDRDRNNDDIDNLIAVPRGVLVGLNTGRIDNTYWGIIKAIEDYLKLKS